MSFAYVQQGLEHWEGYAARRFNDHEELLQTYAGHFNLKEDKGARAARRDLELERKRLESARVHEALATLLLWNHNIDGLEVGIWDGVGYRPFRLKDLAERLVCSICAVKNALRRFRRNRWIHRWQEREYDPTNVERPYKAKVARMWITKEFLRMSRCGGLRRALLHKRKLKAQTKAERAARADLREFSDGVANQLSEGLWAKFERQVMAEHPDWALNRDREFKRIHQAVEAKIAEWRRHRPPPS